MKLIVGLGNPGKKYAKNRHNLGFMVVDELVRNEGLSWRYSPDWIAYYRKKGDDYVLLKPATFMNRSGLAVKAASNFFKIPKKDILVIHDDLDLPFGKIRLSFDSLSAGNKGIDSIIENLAGVDFGRLRIGIGSPRKAEAGKPKRKADTEKYVLSDFTKEEQKDLKNIIIMSKEAIKSYLADGVQATMNRFN